MLPGLDKAEGRELPQEEPVAVPLPEDPESLKAIIETLRADIAELKAERTKEVEYWKGKFKRCDAHNGELQTEVAQLKGK